MISNPLKKAWKGELEAKQVAVFCLLANIPLFMVRYIPFKGEYDLLFVTVYGSTITLISAIMLWKNNNAQNGFIRAVIFLLNGFLFIYATGALTYLLIFLSKKIFNF